MKTRMPRAVSWTVSAALFVCAAAAAQSIPRPGNEPARGNASPATPPREAGYGPDVNYQLECAGCHLSAGQGARANDVPRMKGVLGHFLKVPGGRQYLVRVPGVSQSSYTDTQVAELLNWMLTGAIAGDSTPPDFTPYTAAEVAQLRHPLERTRHTRAVLIRRMRKQGIAIADGISQKP